MLLRTTGRRRSDALDGFTEPAASTRAEPALPPASLTDVGPETLPASLNVEDVMRELGLGGADSGSNEDIVKQMEAAFKFMQENPDFSRTIQELAKSFPDDLRTLER